MTAQCRMIAVKDLILSSFTPISKAPLTVTYVKVSYGQLTISGQANNFEFSSVFIKIMRPVNVFCFDDIGMQ